VNQNIMTRWWWLYARKKLPLAAEKNEKFITEVVITHDSWSAKENLCGDCANDEI
jgi:hypothetical protein